MVDQGRSVQCDRCAAEWKVYGPGLHFCRRCGLMLGGGEPIRFGQNVDWQGYALVAGGFVLFGVVLSVFHALKG